jgi:hypothetical protein
MARPGPEERWYGYGERPVGKRSRFRQDHDRKAVGEIKRAVRSGQVSRLSPQLRQYGRERDLIG